MAWPRILSSFRPTCAPVAQGIEQRISNPLVGGSIPPRRAIPILSISCATLPAIRAYLAYSVPIALQAAHGYFICWDFRLLLLASFFRAARSLASFSR